MIYYSPSADDGIGAFFNDMIHGARLVAVVDSRALSTALAGLTAEEFADEEALADVAERRADLLRNPPLQMVPNPDCRIPEDAVEIGDAAHATLMEGASRGLAIVWDAQSGLPFLQERPVDPAALIAQVKNERDRLLRESDWTQMPDNELSKNARGMWKVWRQSVRDACREYEAMPGNLRPATNKVFASWPEDFA